MNNVTYEVKTEKYDSGTIGSLDFQNFQLNSNYQRPTISGDSTNEEKSPPYLY